jgi:hypothetical protein
MSDLLGSAIEAYGEISGGTPAAHYLSDYDEVAFT